LDGTTPSAIRNAIERVWFASTRIAFVETSPPASSSVESYAAPDRSLASSISGQSMSVSKTERLFWRIAAMRSRPMPVSMFLAGSSEID
jgi:hypothetical protein